VNKIAVPYYVKVQGTGSVTLYRLPTTASKVQGQDNPTLGRDKDDAAMRAIGTYKVNDTLTYLLVETWEPRKDGLNLMFVEKNAVQEFAFNGITAEKLREIGFVNYEGDYSAMVNELNRMLIKYDITSDNQLRHFFSQALVETGGGRDLVEKGSDSYFDQYENRFGNTEPGDGKKYSGAGFLQMTFYDHYRDFERAMGDPEITRQGREYVAKKFAWESACWTWAAYKRDKINPALNMNIKNSTLKQCIDDGRVSEVKQVTFWINGGSIGLDDREDYYKALKDVTF